VPQATRPTTRAGRAAATAERTAERTSARAAGKPPRPVPAKNAPAKAAKTATRTAVRPPKQPTAAPTSGAPSGAGQAELEIDVAAELAGPPARYVNGLLVLSDEPVPSSLPVKPGQPPLPIHSLRLLTLADGSTTYGCRDCTAFTGTRGDVQKHRYADHGAPKPGNKGKRSAGDPPVSVDLASMTIGDLIELVRDAGQWGDLFAAQDLKIEEWRSRALAAEAWKRKVVVRMSALGFKLDEDEGE